MFGGAEGPGGGGDGAWGVKGERKKKERDRGGGKNNYESLQTMPLNQPFPTAPPTLFQEHSCNCLTDTAHFLHCLADCVTRIVSRLPGTDSSVSAHLVNTKAEMELAKIWNTKTFCDLEKSSSSSRPNRLAYRKKYTSNVAGMMRDIIRNPYKKLRRHGSASSQSRTTGCKYTAHTWLEYLHGQLCMT